MVMLLRTEKVSIEQGIESGLEVRLGAKIVFSINDSQFFMTVGLKGQYNQAKITLINHRLCDLTLLTVFGLCNFPDSTFQLVLIVFPLLVHR